MKPARLHHRRIWRRRVRIALILAGLAGLLVGARADAAQNLQTGPVSGLPLPRFVSLKSDRVNVRGGPSKDHEVAWIFTNNGLPVEIIAEFENWRRVRDWEGAEGWIYHSLLSGRRTALVRLPANETLADLFERPDSQSRLAARLQAGVLASVHECSGSWCQISGNGFEGWIEQSHLFGVYPGEKVN